MQTISRKGPALLREAKGEPLHRSGGKSSETIRQTLTVVREDIVRTLWRHEELIRLISNQNNTLESSKGSAIPFRVSSEAHEWRNDQRTVSTKSSVKMRFP